MATIMLVDDDIDVAEIIGECLSEAGYTVDVFTSGIEALNSCVDCRYAMVIADINMPEIDGLSLLQMIRAQRPHMPYLVMSGGFASMDSEVIRSADSFHYKTDGIVKLLKKVQAILILKGTNAGTSQTLLAV